MNTKKSETPERLKKETSGIFENLEKGKTCQHHENTVAFNLFGVLTSRKKRERLFASKTARDIEMGRTAMKILIVAI